MRIIGEIELCSLASESFKAKASTLRNSEELVIEGIIIPARAEIYFPPSEGRKFHQAIVYIGDRSGSVIYVYTKSVRIKRRSQDGPIRSASSAGGSLRGVIRSFS